MGGTSKSARSPSDPERRNAAITRGRKDVASALLGSALISGVMGFAWLQLYTFPGEDGFDLLRRLKAVRCDLENDLGTTIAFIGAFAAIAIAAAVGLDATLKRLETLRAQRPPSESSPASGHRLHGRPRTPRTDAAHEWLRQRAAFQAVTTAEMLFLFVMTGLAGMIASALVTEKTRLPAVITWALAVFLFLEALRCLMALMGADQLSIAPVPLALATRLDRLSAPSRGRTLYLACRTIALLAATAASTFLFAQASDMLKAVTGSVVLLVFFLVVQAGATQMVASAVTEVGVNRFLTVTIGGLMAVVLFMILQLTMLVAAFEPVGRDDLLLWGTGLTAIFTTLLVLHVLDQAGIGPRTSRAVLRMDQGDRPGAAATAPAPASQLILGAAVACALVAVTLPMSLLFAGILVVSAIVLLMCRDVPMGWRIVIAAASIGALLLLGLRIDPERYGPSPALWAAYGLLLVVALVPRGARATRTAGWVASALGFAPALRRGIRARRLATWIRRLDDLEVARVVAGDRVRYLPRKQPLGGGFRDPRLRTPSSMRDIPHARPR